MDKTLKNVVYLIPDENCLAPRAAPMDPLGLNAVYWPRLGVARMARTKSRGRIFDQKRCQLVLMGAAKTGNRQRLILGLTFVVVAGRHFKVHDYGL